MNSSITLLTALGAAFITFLVARRVFQQQFKIGPPTLLAAAVAGLAFLGLISEGGAVLAVLLLPFKALALCLLVLFLLLLLFLFLLAVGILENSSSDTREKRSSHSHLPSAKPRAISNPRPRATGLGEIGNKAPTTLSRKGSEQRNPNL